MCCRGPFQSQNLDYPRKGIMNLEYGRKLRKTDFSRISRRLTCSFRAKFLPQPRNTWPVAESEFWSLCLESSQEKKVCFGYFYHFRVAWVYSRMGGCPGTMSGSRSRPGNPHDRDRDSKPRDKNLRDYPATKIPRDNNSRYFGTRIPLSLAKQGWCYVFE